MIVVQSLNSIVPVTSLASESLNRSLSFHDSRSYAYQVLYRTQPNARTCVDFLSRNLAQIGIHTYTREDDNSRVRMRGTPLSDLMERPNAFTTQYRFIESLAADMGIWFNAFVLKVRAEGKLTLLRIPPPLVTVHGGLVPTLYEIGDMGGDPLRVTPSEMIHFRGYNPESSIIGLSPLETLRRILAEEYAMGEYREGYWKNAARMSGIIERPAEAPVWSDSARARFKEEFEALYSGEGGSGATAILEEGMKWNTASFSPGDSEYLSSRKLTREECARAYHIPLPMVGILDNATFSNIKEQHRNLYQDCLGPWMQMMTQDLELQLLDEFPGESGAYLEFNIEEKLRGSFEETAVALQSSIGRAWMTPNEGRAKMNLPSIDGGDELTPAANAPGSEFGGSTGADETLPPDETGGAKGLPGTKARGIDPTLPALRKKHRAKWEAVLQHHFKRQMDAILPRVPKKAGSPPGIEEVWKDPERWNSELAADLYQLNKATSSVWAKWMGDRLKKEVDPDLMDEYLAEVSKYDSEGINNDIRDSVKVALAKEEPNKALREMFDSAIALRAGAIAVGGVTSAASFGAHEGAKQAGVRLKTWQVNSGNPRPSHAAMNGQTVRMQDNFSTGQRWPGDPAGGADEVAGCECSVIFGEVTW